MVSGIKGFASPIAQLVKNLPAMQETQMDSWVRKILWRRDRLPTPVFLGFPCGSAGEESACNAGDLGSISGLGRSPGEGKGYPLQCSGLKNSRVSPWGHKELDTTERLSLSRLIAASCHSTWPSNSLSLSFLLCNKGKAPH